jgi:hypothetical protein
MSDDADTTDLRIMKLRLVHIRDQALAEWAARTGKPIGTPGQQLAA